MESQIYSRSFIRQLDGRIILFPIAIVIIASVAAYQIWELVWLLLTILFGGFTLFMILLVKYLKKRERTILMKVDDNYVYTTNSERIAWCNIASMQFTEEFEALPIDYRIDWIHGFRGGRRWKYLITIETNESESIIIDASLFDDSFEDVKKVVSGFYERNKASNK